MEAGSTRQQILDAAEELLHRYGPAKTTVTDVARHLGMSHANVYRHFASKAALQDAVAARWLHEAVVKPLQPVAESDVTPPERLRAWLWALIEFKRRKVTNDPEMFETYHVLATQARDVVRQHVSELCSQIERIIADGGRSGDFRTEDPAATAHAVFSATVRFHHPYFLRDAAVRPTEAEAAAVIDLVMAGLSVRPGPA
jgi:AcrR family transcriptional regulator